MKTLDLTTDGNLGGLSRIYAIPATSFKRIWQDHTNSLNYLRVINREDIIEIYCSDNANFSEPYEKGLYKPALSGFVPASSPITDKQLRTLVTPAHWLVLFEDNNGFWRLAGSAENKLTFNYTDQTGALSGVNQLAFTFTGSARFKSKFIDMAEIDEL